MEGEVVVLGDLDLGPIVAKARELNRMEREVEKR